jgi:hypothetical protein
MMRPINAGTFGSGRAGTAVQRLHLHPRTADPHRTSGLRTAYASVGPAQWLANALIAAGWILATAVIAGITRTVRRD